MPIAAIVVARSATKTIQKSATSMEEPTVRTATDRAYRSALSSRAPCSFLQSRKYLLDNDISAKSSLDFTSLPCYSEGWDISK